MSEEKAKKEAPEFVQHMREARKAFRKQWGCLIPDEFWQYGRTARRETLLAMRSLVDAAIEHIEEKGEAVEAPKPRTTRRKTKVEVE